MERRSITVRGIVQGVGFRPFVCNLASRLYVGGFVRNRTDGVCIEVEGRPEQLDEFLARLLADAPPLARIDEMTWDLRPPQGEASFRIQTSSVLDAGEVVIAPDVGTCAECLRELFDPTDRRYRYPFLNCTNCGPRLTIVTGAPYDRARTTMSSFTMCAACRAEYVNPADRRFHAQPIACPACGPSLRLINAGGGPVFSDDPLAAFVDAIRAGRIGAIKGLGGFHLACDARNAHAVEELRRRKHREEKPFAVMVPNVESVRALCQVSNAEENLLASSRRPIVLLRKHSGYDLAEKVAPENPYLGVMLPSTPLHHILLHDLGGWSLVMTSGNRSDEPIAYLDDDATERLTGIADLFLSHNRPIHVRCDDSVTRVVLHDESPVRRSRGYAPSPLLLPFLCSEPILAVGAQLRATFGIGQGHHAVLSHHAGDLSNYEGYRAYERDIGLYEQLFGIRPAIIAHDLHPDYASTRYARDRAAMEGTRLISVQHHHAHMASCMAEHRLTGQVIGVTFDGTGYGTDCRVWGGEFLIGGYGAFRRAARLRNVPMPGGEQAVREPWRMAVAHLIDAGQAVECVTRRIPSEASRAVVQMIDRRFNAPETSSVGRLFDAVASLVGVRDRISHEGQAALELEWLATEVCLTGSYPFVVTEVHDVPRGDTLLDIDTRPLVAAVVQDVHRGEPAAAISRRFHTTMSDIIVEVCSRLRQDCGLDRVALTGGVFLNRLLAEEASCRLAAAGFHVYRHRLVPAGDGGLSLGQIAVAAAKTGERSDL